MRILIFLMLMLTASSTIAAPVVIAAAMQVATAWAANEIVGSVLLFAVKAFVINAVLYAASSALSKSKDAGSMDPGRDQVVRSSTETCKILYGEAMVSGPLVFVATSSAAARKYSIPQILGNSIKNNQMVHIVIALAAHEVEAIEEVYFNDDVINVSDIRADGWVQSGKYEGRARIIKHLGSPDQVADASLVAANVGWTNAHRLQGIAYLYVALSWDQNVYTDGLPNIKARVRGKKLYDPRTGVTQYGTNWALAIRDYLVNDYGLGCDVTEIDEASIIAAANISDEQVEYASGQRQTRYTANGIVDMGQKIGDVMTNLLSAGAGALVYATGKYKLFAGAHLTPTFTITESDLRDSVKVKPRLSRKELYNVVKGTFVDPTKNWQATDFPQVSSQLYIDEDGGEELTTDITLPFTTDGIAAQRLAKIQLEKSRQGMTVELPCKLTVMGVEVWQNVNVSIPQLGWDNKEFKVISWKFDPAGGVDLTLQEEAAESYEWNYGNATTYDPAPDTNLPDPGYVAPVGVLTVVQGPYNGGVTATASWEESPDAFVEKYQLEYRRTADSDWTVLPATAGLSLALAGLSPAEYEIRVTAINTLGAKSIYVSRTLTFSALIVSNISGLQLLEGSNLFLGPNAQFKWTPVDPTADQDFMDYEVHVRSGNAVLRVAHTTDAFFEYSLAMNQQDGGPRRQITLDVYARGKQLQLSPVPASITVANPQVGPLTGVVITPVVTGMVIAYTPPADVDFQEVKVWASPTHGFVPDDSTLKYTGSDNNIRIDLTGLETYYIRIAGFDVYGQDAPNLGAEYTANPGDVLALLEKRITGTQLAEDLATRIDKIDAPSAGLTDQVTAHQDQVDAAAESMLNMLIKMDDALNRQRTIKTKTDATMTIDPNTGTVTIIASAPVTTDVEQRLSNVEVEVNASVNEIKSNTSALSTINGTLTSQQTEIDQQNATITLKADKTYVDSSIAGALNGVDPSMLQSNMDLLGQALSNAILVLNQARNEGRSAGANFATAQLQIQANADAISAESTARLSLAAIVNQNGAAITAEQEARADADSSMASQISDLQTQAGNNAAAIQNETDARVSGDEANASSISNLQASLSVNGSQTVTATAFSSLQTTVSNQDGQISTNASSIGTLQTSVNGNTASIQTLQRSVDGISAEWTLKLDVNGKVAGMGAYNNGATSQIIFRTDSFAIEDADTGDQASASAIFMVGKVNGVNTMGFNGAAVIDGSVTATAMAAKTITAESAVIADAAVNTLQLAGQAVTIPVSSYIASTYTGNSTGSGWVEAISCTISSSGAPVEIVASAMLTIKGSLHLDVQLLRYDSNGNLVATIYYVGGFFGFPPNGGVCGNGFQFTETPGAGTWKYSLQFREPSSGNTNSWAMANRCMLLLETKR